MVSLAGAVIFARAAVTTVALIRRAAGPRPPGGRGGAGVAVSEAVVAWAFRPPTRLYNMASATHVFLERFGVNGTPAEPSTPPQHRLPGWLVLVLERDPAPRGPGHRSGRPRRDREVMAAIECVCEVLSDSFRFADLVLRAFRSEQRAIGEVDLPRRTAPRSGLGPRWDCLGYAAFVKALKDKEHARWFATLLDDMDGLADGLDEHRARDGHPAPAGQAARPQRRPGLRLQLRHPSDCRTIP
jgi:hypothetical protein